MAEDLPPVDYQSTVHAMPPSIPGAGYGPLPCCGLPMDQVPKQDRVAHPVAVAQGRLQVTCTGL